MGKVGVMVVVNCRSKEAVLDQKPEISLSAIESKQLSCGQGGPGGYEENQGRFGGRGGFEGEVGRGGCGGGGCGGW